VSREGELPLSYAQQRLWFLHQLKPGSSAYNVPSTVRLVGGLKTPSLGQAFSEIVRRHETLRTSFPILDGEPSQRITEAAPTPMPLVDLSRLNVEMSKRIAQRLGREESQRLFTLTAGPLIRVRLLRLKSEEHVALLTIHHIVSDGWSMRMLTGEVKHLYGAFVTGNPSPLEELSAQYADYAHWQRQWLPKEALDRQLSYWQEKLAGMPQSLELPFARTRPAVGEAQSTTRGLRLTEDLSRGIRALCRREGVTPFMALLAAYKLLLHYYTGKDDIVVGSPIANRTRKEIEPLIGFFVNTLVLRSDLSGNPSFRELLRRVRETCLGAYANQDLPFEQLVQELRPERILTRQPLFQTMFVLQNAPGSPLNVPADRQKLPGLGLRPFNTASIKSPFDLVMQVTEQSGSFYMTMWYDTDVFTSNRIKQVGEDFEALLQGIVAQPDRGIAAYDGLLTDFAGRRQAIEKRRRKELNLQDLNNARRANPIHSVEN
jgi:Condensation domain